MNPGVERGHPLLFFRLLGEFDDQDRVLRRERNQHDQPDLRQDIIAVSYTHLDVYKRQIEVRLMLAAIRKGPESKRGRDLASGIEPTDAGYAPLPAE